MLILTSIILLSFQSFATSIRPDGEVFMGEPCICKNSKPYVATIPACDAFCADTKDDFPMLYAQLTVSDKLAFNPEFSAPNSKILGDAASWCYSEISDGHTSPSCELEFLDTQTPNPTIQKALASVHKNTLIAYIKEIPFGKIYTIRLKERTSGATSTQKQIIYSK